MYIFGSSGHGKVVQSVLNSTTIIVRAFVDDNPKGAEFMGLPVYIANTIEDVSAQTFIIAIGDNRIRKKIAERLGSHYGVAIDVKASVDVRVKIGAGTVVMPMAVINADTQIGKHVIVNSGAVVEHDCVLGDYVHVSPNATLTGDVVVGEGTHIGAGAVVLPGVHIGKWCVVGAGAVVLKDLPDYAVAVGNPARIIRVVSCESR